MTEQEARKAGMVPITEWAFPGSRIETVRGAIEFAEWVRQEGDRIQAAGRKVAIVCQRRQIALFGEPHPNLRPERHLRV
jgi:hypothetical protein